MKSLLLVFAAFALLKSSSCIDEGFQGGITLPMICQWFDGNRCPAGDSDVQQLCETLWAKCQNSTEATSTEGDSNILTTTTDGDNFDRKAKNGAVARILGHHQGKELRHHEVSKKHHDRKNHEKKRDEQEKKKKKRKLHERKQNHHSRKHEHEDAKIKEQ